MSNIIVELRSYFMRHWQACTAFFVVFAVISFTLLFKINALLPGYSGTEQAVYEAARSLKVIWDNPINAPYELLVYGIRHIVGDSLLAGRIASALIGWLTIILFCILVYRWHGTRTAVIGTLLFGTSSWFLHTARLGTPEVMLFGFFVLVACGVWLREKKTGWPVFAGLLLSALLLYTPGMIWFLGLGLVWQLPTIDKAFKKNPTAVIGGSLFFLAILAPLALYLYHNPAFISDWLCVPENWKQPLHLIGNVLHVPLSVFIRQPVDNPEMWLGRLPVLSIFGSLAFVLGTYVYWRHAKLMRVRILAWLGIFGAVVIGLSDSRIGLAVLVPFIYLVAAGGAGYLIDAWYKVFPRNPIARNLGLAIGCAVLAMACTYNLRSYFVAWPQATITRQVFTVQQP